MRQLGTSRDDSSSVNFLTNLCGDAIGRLPYERMDPGVLNDTPEVSFPYSERIMVVALTN